MPAVREFFSTLGRFAGLKLKADRKAEEALRKREKHEIAKAREVRAKTEETRKHDKFTLDMLQKGIAPPGSSESAEIRAQMLPVKEVMIKGIREENVELQKQIDIERDRLVSEQDRILTRAREEQDKRTRFLEVKPLIDSGQIEPSEAFPYVETGQDRPVGLPERKVIQLRERKLTAGVIEAAPTPKELASVEVEKTRKLKAEQERVKFKRTPEFNRALAEYEDLTTKGVPGQFGERIKIPLAEVHSRLFRGYKFETANKVLEFKGQRTFYKVPTNPKQLIPKPRDRAEVKALWKADTITREQAGLIIQELDL